MPLWATLHPGTDSDFVIAETEITGQPIVFSNIRHHSVARVAMIWADAQRKTLIKAVPLTREATVGPADTVRITMDIGEDSLSTKRALEELAGLLKIPAPPPKLATLWDHLTADDDDHQLDSSG